VVPTIHWVLINDGFSSGIVRIMLPKIVIMYAICGFAFFFYVTKFPERLLPGFLDIVGHSHQWWHVFIFIGEATAFSSVFVVVGQSFFTSEKNHFYYKNAPCYVLRCKILQRRRCKFVGLALGVNFRNLHYPRKVLRTFFIHTRIKHKII
jgi:hypothetical protein